MAERDRLVLGTVSLGLPYGLAPKGKLQPELMPEEDAHDLVRLAVSRGITTFDTAPAYGESEARLGRVLGASAIVWTKLHTNVSSGPQLFEQAEKSVLSSLERLMRPRLDVLQWHNWTRDLENDPFFVSAWRRLGEDPRISKLGCSTYGVEDAVAAVQSGLFGLVQVEGNLLNPRVLDAVVGPARAAGIAIAVRSVFLQGVLTSKGEALPKHLAGLATYRDQALQVAADLRLSLNALALRWALDHPAVSYALVGLDGADQLNDVLVAADHAPLGLSVPELAVPDPELVDPRRWPALAERNR